MCYLVFILFILSFNSATLISDGETVSKKSEFPDLETLAYLANATPGKRHIFHCLVDVKRNDCTVNITAFTSPCPVVKITGHLFPNIDIQKLSGGFINEELSLISLELEFDKKSSICVSDQGSVELNINSTGKHVRLIERMFLPLKVVLLQATWPLHLKPVRSIDLEINGIFISDNLNGFSKIPSYEGVVMEMRKPKGLTIFEMKTTKLQSIQLKHLIKDFNINIDGLTNNLSLKTKVELSLQKLIFTDALLIGYIEPGVMLELQLTGKHSGSLAFTNSNQVFVIIQKYKLQLKPNIAIFGKIRTKNVLDIELLKLASITEIPAFSFISHLQEHLLVVALDKFPIVNIKQAREASNDFYCSECRVRFLPGLNLIFKVPDVFNFLKTDQNSTTQSKKTVVIHPNKKHTVMSTKLQRKNVITRFPLRQTTKIARNPRLQKNGIVRYPLQRKNLIVQNSLQRKNVIINSRKKRLKYYLENLKRSKIYHATELTKGISMDREIRANRLKRDDEIKDVLLNTTETFNGNDSLMEFDESFLMDSFNPFPRTYKANTSRLSPITNSTTAIVNITFTNISTIRNVSKPLYNTTFVNTTLLKNKTINSTNSNQNDLLPKDFPKTENNKTGAANATSIFANWNESSASSPLPSSTQAVKTSPISTSPFASEIASEIQQSTLNLFGANKHFDDSFGADTFSFHDINSLTNEKQEVDTKATLTNQLKRRNNKKTNSMMVFGNIDEKEINLVFPQQTEGKFEDIIKFLLSPLEGKMKCNILNITGSKLSINYITITDDVIRITLNTTKTQDIVPDLLSINQNMGIVVNLMKDIGGSFDYDNVVVTGSGKQKILLEEISAEIVQTTDDCYLVGKLPLPTIQNISAYFNAEYVSDANEYVGKISIEHLNVTTTLSSARAVKMKGLTRRYGKTRFNIHVSVWNEISRDKRRMALAFTARFVPIDRILQLCFGRNLILPPWLILEDAAIAFSMTGVKANTFDDDILKQLPQDPGIVFTGKLLRPIQCETYLANDRFCQYFHAKLPNPIQLKGTITKNKFSIKGKAATSMMISQEVIMVDPNVIIMYEDDIYDVNIVGTIIVEMRGMRYKTQGRISRHGSGFVLLQIASQSNHDFLNTTLLNFKPFLAVAQLSKRSDFACVFELHPSHISVGVGNETMRLINPSGRLVPSDSSGNYLHGTVNNLSVSKLFELLNIEINLSKLSMLKDLKFTEYTKVVYSESKKDMQYDFILENVIPGFTFYGELIFENYNVKTMVNIDANKNVKLTMDWPLLNMSRGMIVFKRSKDDMMLGPVLSLTSSLNSRETSLLSMKSFVSALGMEQSNVEIQVEKENQGIKYMFVMRSKVFNEVQMTFMYRGYEAPNLGFRVKGHIPNPSTLKIAAKMHVQNVFNDFITLYTREKKENEKQTADIDTLIKELGSTIESNVKSKLKDLIIQLEDIEENIQEYLKGIEIECVEECNKPVEIQTLQDLEMTDIELKNIHMQHFAPRWATNVSCIAGCEVRKGILHKKATERLSSARMLYPLYDKQKQRAATLDGFLKVAEKIKDTGMKAKAYFLKHSQNGRQVIDKFMAESSKANWFQLLDVAIPEVDTISLKGKLPCFKMIIKFLLYKQEKEITKEICINGEFLHNVAQQVFYTVFSKSEIVGLTQHFDKVKSFYTRIRQRRQELIDVIRHDDEMDGFDDNDLINYEEMSKRDGVFKPLVKKDPQKDDLFDKRFKKLVLTTLPQYSVHSYKTIIVMNQKSPWAIFKLKQEKRTSLARRVKRNVSNTTARTISNEDSDCSTVNGVVSKYSHITNALVDLVEAYNQGRVSFAETRDQLIDSLHTLDSTITNEANRTYYTKGELKDMIYWSVRVWKGVEDWVQASTRQFEDHNHNAITQFTDQLNDVFSGEHASTAAGFVNKLSHIGAVAMKRMIVSSSPIVKKSLPMQPDDLVQNVALSISQFLTTKDMTLDEATHKIQNLKTAVYTLVSHVPPCDPVPVPSTQGSTASQLPPPTIDMSMIANDAGATSAAVRDSTNNGSPTIVTQSTGTIVTENSGSITMGGSPQIITEPSNSEQTQGENESLMTQVGDPTHDIIDASNVPMTVSDSSL